MPRPSRAGSRCTINTAAPVTASMRSAAVWCADLRASNFLSMDFFYNIVLDGALKDAGMASFKSALSRDDAAAIRNFIIHRANQDSKAAPPH